MRKLTQVGSRRYGTLLGITGALLCTLVGGRAAHAQYIGTDYSGHLAWVLRQAEAARQRNYARQPQMSRNGSLPPGTTDLRGYFRGGWTTNNPVLPDLKKLADQPVNLKRVPRTEAELNTQLARISARANLAMLYGDYATHHQWSIAGADLKERFEEAERRAARSPEELQRVLARQWQRRAGAFNWAAGVRRDRRSQDAVSED